MAGRPRKFEKYDNAFTDFAKTLGQAIERIDDGSTQKQQVEALLKAERDFRAEVVKRKSASTKIYRKFLDKICVQNKNILSARPYFRVGAKSFSEFVTPAIKNEDIDTLKTFDINFRFAVFIKENWLGPLPKAAEESFNRLQKCRERLIYNNLPLAINRAKLFFRKVPQSHLDLMDFISLCAQGLATGIDKWDGPYSRVWRSCCIGFMTGYLIDAYSETMMHFYPDDRKFLYKANKVRARFGISEPLELAHAVNESFKEDQREKGYKLPKYEIQESELFNLLNAASPVSAEAPLGEEGFGVYSFTVDPTQDVEGAYIQRESTMAMLEGVRSLPLILQKILRLKGVSF